MTYTRRSFVRSTGTLLSTVCLPTRLVGSSSHGPWQSAVTEYPYDDIADTQDLNSPEIRELTAAALDAARSAGASYADVRLTITREHSIQHYNVRVYPEIQREHRALGVRTLVNGAWGFTASPVWTREEAARLGRESASVAKANAAVNARAGVSPVTLDERRPDESGSWSTPVRNDPFLVPFPEKADVIVAYIELTNRMLEKTGGPGGTVTYRRQEKVLATTDGVFQTQTLYWMDPQYSLGNQYARQASSVFQPTAGGWDAYTDLYPRLREELPSLFEILAEKGKAIPVMPDRCDVVFDAYAMAKLVGHTIGVASEFDRALGWEANAGGTSYLAPPRDILGTRIFGSPLVNVTADRSRPGGSATVKWDDEGVAPSKYSLVKEGMLVDYHRTREFTAEFSSLRPIGEPNRLHGCASAENAMKATMVQTPNIELTPGNDGTTFDDLVSGLARGLVVCDGGVFTDRQQLNGEVDGHWVYEVRNGKKVTAISQTEILFRSPELWKNVVAIAGAQSARYSGLSVKKGQPEQAHQFGIGAVPALIRNVAVTNIMRKS